jgi:hypothetical protein
VHQNLCLDFSTVVVIFLSRCDFPAVISVQKISAETVHPRDGDNSDVAVTLGDADTVHGGEM